MKTIIWKELRENFKWALLGILGVGLAMAVVLKDGADRGESIGREDFLVMLLFAGPILGAALGFLQTIFDARQGYWAVLVHRPISRDRIFAGKVIAGLCLYLMAMLIPLLLSAWWAQVPGNVAAPFRWAMAVPGLIAILTGAVFYFAGILVARRDARWYASRCLPLITAILCPSLLFAVYHWWQAASVVLAFIVIMAVAARGSFLASGEYKPQHWTTKSSLGVVLTAGICLIGLVVIAFISEFIPEKVDNSYIDTTYINAHLLRDGRVVIEEQKGGKRVLVRDLDGNPLPNMMEPDVGVDPLEMLLPPSTSVRLKPIKFSRIWDHAWYRKPHALMRVDLQRAPDTLWYYLTDTGRFEGYDRKTHRYIGSLGPDGFAPPGQETTDRFPPKLIYDRSLESLANLISTDDGVYRVDLNERSVELVIKQEPDKPIKSVQGIWRNRYIRKWNYSGGVRHLASDNDWELAGFAVLIENQLRLFDWDMNPLSTHSFDYGPPEYSYVTINKLDPPDTYAFVYHLDPEHVGDQAFDMPSPIVIHGPDGYHAMASGLPPYQYDMKPGPIKYGFFGLITPPGPYAAYRAVERSRYPAYSRFTQYESNFRITMAVCALLSGLICLLINYRLTGRLAMDRNRRYVWAALGLLLGPSSVLLMLCLLPWCAKVRCDACGKSRLVTRFDCKHCGTKFAPPPTDGTEIFDNPVATPA